MNPVVIVLCIGDKSPIEIIKNIGQSTDAANSPETITIGSGEFSAYTCDIKTKYYENKISLIPFQDDVDAIPADVLKVAEAIIVHFDAQNKSFMQDIPKLNKAVEDNNIELGLLLTDNLYDDSSMGLTFKDVKSKCTNTFDLIELCAENSDDEATIGDAPIYDEVQQALQNNIWSNIEVGSSAGGKLANVTHLDNMPSMEEQLEAFDTLLSNIQNFKRVSANMNRDQVLDEAEKIAQLFVNILNED